MVGGSALDSMMACLPPAAYMPAHSKIEDEGMEHNSVPCHCTFQWSTLDVKLVSAARFVGTESHTERTATTVPSASQHL